MQLHRRSQRFLLKKPQLLRKLLKQLLRKLLKQLLRKLPWKRPGRKLPTKRRLRRKPL